MKKKKKVEVLKTRDQVINFLRKMSMTSMVKSLKVQNDPNAPKDASAFADGMMMASMELLYCMGEPVPEEIKEMISDHIELVLVASGNIDTDKTNN